MTDFDYKKYSLEQLDNWIHDAVASSEATPQEIYNVIVNAVSDNYYCFKQQTSNCYELLALLNGNGKGHLSCDRNDPSDECKNSWNDFWEESYYPEPNQKQYTKEELTEISNSVILDLEKEKAREYNLREAEYYNKRAELDAISRNDSSRLKYESGWIYESPDGGKTVTKRKVGSTEKILVKEDKVIKWQLPVEIDGPSGEYFVQFPDDLLEAADLKEGDSIEWVDRGDGSYLLKKTTKPLGSDEC